MDNNSYSVGDRRKYKRLKIGTLFTYQVEKPLSLRKIIGHDKEVNALMLDLSAGGMGFLTEYSMPADAVLFMKFILIYSVINDSGDGKEKVKSIEAIGTTRYNILVDRNEHRLGICFTYISEEDKKIIANLTKSHY